MIETMQAQTMEPNIRRSVVIGQIYDDVLLFVSTTRTKSVPGYTPAAKGARSHTILAST